MIRHIAARPPMTPPMMVPVGLELALCEEGEFEEGLLEVLFDGPEES